uniref:Uncharacterized protein n=1 Tax=Rhizophora mucronata TaxID=61149 RepID=A0A2P2LR98_RHIMU
MKTQKTSHSVTNCYGFQLFNHDSSNDIIEQLLKGHLKRAKYAEILSLYSILEPFGHGLKNLRVAWLLILFSSGSLGRRITQGKFLPQQFPFYLAGDKRIDNSEMSTVPPASSEWQSISHQEAAF